MALEFSKTGQGAFRVVVEDDGTTIVNIGAGPLVRAPHTMFPNAKDAYTFYRGSAGSGDHAAWNVCYFLEDVVDGNFPDPAA